MKRSAASGFSLIEMAIVIAIAIIACSVCFVSLQPSLQQMRVTNAYNTTMATIRQAREAAVSQRWTYIVTFSNASTPNTITVNQATSTCNGLGTQLTQTSLPNDVSFTVVSGVPTSPNGTFTTPDGFGSAGRAIDFDQGVSGGDTNSLCFYPDGSVHDANGYTNSGVIYLARPGDLFSSRAITVWGATGRLRGWRLYTATSNGGSTYWRQQ